MTTSAAKEPQYTDGVSTSRALPPSLAGRVTMLYDGGCPLCSKEVAHYRRVDHEQKVNWVDIDQDTSVLQTLGIGKTAAMKHLHVISAGGDIVKGAYAFATVWEQLPRYRYLARVVRFPGVLRLLDKVYNAFAIRRFSRRSRCNDELCS